MGDRELGGTAAPLGVIGLVEGNGVVRGKGPVGMAWYMLDGQAMGVVRVVSNDAGQHGLAMG